MNKLRMLSILDDFTYNNLKYEDNLEILHKKPLWYRFSQKIDLLLVESTWRGNRDQWRHKVASYPNHPERNIDQLKNLVLWCKENSIPTVFWNKEDPFHYDRFIDSAKLFDYIFTTDANSIKHYHNDAPSSKSATATFFVQPKIHFRDESRPLKRSLFMGTYEADIHQSRHIWQDNIFSAAAPFGLDLVNRHALDLDQYKFPQYSGDVKYFAPMPYVETPKMYRRYQQILNVNTITDSPTMFSRRLIEIMACGRLAISNPSHALEHLFKDMCIPLSEIDEAQNLFAQLQYGYTPNQIAMLEYAHQHVLKNFTAKAWLKSILIACNIDHPYLET